MVTQDAQTTTRGRKKNTVYMQFNQRKKKGNEDKRDEEWIVKYESYLKSIGSVGACTYVKASTKSKTKKCDCLQKLGNDDFPKLRRSVAEYCFEFNKKSQLKKSNIN